MLGEIRNKFYRQVETRCSKCPMFYNYQGHDDWDCGCVESRDIEKFCVYSALPKFVQEIKYKHFIKKENKRWE